MWLNNNYAFTSYLKNYMHKNIFFAFTGYRYILLIYCAYYTFPHPTIHNPTYIDMYIQL